MRWGAAGVAGATSVGGGHDALSRLGLVYLSHVNDPATTSLFPGDPAFTLEVIATIPADGFYMQFVREGEHTGTHWGAPGHFQEGGLLADQLDPGDLFLPAVKIDIRAQSAGDADYGATIDDIRRWERRYGRIPRGAAVILWTGWEDKWGRTPTPTWMPMGSFTNRGSCSRPSSGSSRPGDWTVGGALGHRHLQPRQGRRHRLRRVGGAL